MVGMLVGDKDGINLSGADTKSSQAPPGLPGSKPGVDEHASTTNFDQQ